LAYTSQLEVETAVFDALATMRDVDRQEIAMFLIDPVVLYILAATSKRCLTVSEMVPVVNLPVATCYKLVYQMEKLGLIACCGTGRTNGRGKAAVYTSVMKEMNLDMKNNVINISVTWKNGITESFNRELSANSVCPYKESRVTVTAKVLVEERDEALSSD
jgi:hypothetical protein